MTNEKQEALKEMPNGSDINDIGDWAFKHRNTIRAALTEAPNTDADELRKESREVVRGYIERTWGSSALADDLRGAFDEFIDHITSNYHLVKKEKKDD